MKLGFLLALEPEPLAPRVEVLKVAVKRRFKFDRPPARSYRRVQHRRSKRDACDERGETQLGLLRAPDLHDEIASVNPRNDCVDKPMPEAFILSERMSGHY